MFITIEKIEQSTYPADKLQNPKIPGNAMVLGIYRNKIRTAIYVVNTKKTFGEYWDTVENKKIAKRLWTPEMTALYKEKAQEAPRPPFVFKITIIGWIFLLLIVSALGMLMYNSFKPASPKPATYLAMEKAPTEGDIYFGRYEIYKEKGQPIGMEGRYGWFRVARVEGDVYYLAPSTEMSASHQPKEQLNNTDFANETLSPVKLKEQTGYNIHLLSDDGLTEIYITDKK